MRKKKQDDFAKSIKRDKQRYIILIVCCVLCFLIFFVRVFELQIVEADKYVAQAAGITTITAPIKAARGEILDCYGRPIATNREGYNIIFNYASIKRDTINDTILSLVKLVKDVEIKDDLPISATEPYTFTGTESSVNRMLDMLRLAHYATPENCFTELVKKYSLEDRDRATQRTIMGIRYTMDRAGFSISVPYTFAEDVGSNIMTRVSEDPQYSENGVAIEIASFRKYEASSVAPHIIGELGAIDAKNWEKYKEKGYSYNDKVGKSGIEKACENELRGQDGTITYSVNSKGKILSSTVTKEPVAGNTVRLTIDKNIQLSAQAALAETVKSIPTATTGAAVAINIKTGGVLASANYPTYTYDQYKKDYKALADDPAHPLFDRAFNGTYPPGSVFKPAVACAALQAGVVTAGETITCTGKYRRFDNYQPHCMHVHGPMNITNALSKSCNYYFFEAGYRLGIKRLNEYCLAFGLGDYTGVEVSENKGILAGPSSKEHWFDGYTLSASIGQSDNSFTPLQLAAYTATIANDGIRYKTTLVDKIMSYSQSEVVKQNKATVLNKVNVNKNVIDTVKNGMLSVTEDGTGSRIFKDYSITVGGKTGTAETTKGVDNAVFIAFAPYDDPEIAVAVVVEHGKFGTYAGNLVKSIFSSYFFTQMTNTTESPAYQLLQ